MTQIVKIKDSVLRQAAEEGMDAFVQVFVDAISEAVGGEMTAETFAKLHPDQITLWGYSILRSEVMDGGFVQLIHNGYAPFFFNNPFAKAMRLWGLKDLCKLVYKAKDEYDLTGDSLTRECTEDEFMALFEAHPQFDDLDDKFVENEEEYTAAIAQYVDEHIENFAQIIAD